MTGQRPATVEQLAELVAERLDYDRLGAAVAEHLERRSAEGHALISAKEIAARIGCSPRWVREHKAELRAVPMSDGPRPRLGFYPPLSTGRWPLAAFDSRRWP